jgi:hypothetical protein
MKELTFNIKLVKRQNTEHKLWTVYIDGKQDDKELPCSMSSLEYRKDVPEVIKNFIEDFLE